MKDTTEALNPDGYYHIYNHAVGCDNLFRTPENYNYFLKKYTQYVSPVADTFAYCLMPNHFHLAVRIKPQSELQALPKPTTPEHTSDFISQQFSNFFNAYSKAFNRQQQRRGNLFERPFKRKQIDSDMYFRQLIHYIHFNPVHHGFVADLRDWPHSLFASFFSEKATQLKRKEVIAWFGDKENFYVVHQQQIDEKLVLEME